ncbi:dipeptidase PepV [Clostridium sp. D2Q-11]|uniref:Dipeptidase PepV n=1 Tax=Anaeromonas frigoriresistens TaxID=2683708 RepID=A0A942Z947_9FIRM|nr:dipeptidase PepV [Anaeromonas frigoriresistens]MBS4538719.1 dipeptidase PepV [Anaeromonas frigoriresistens]
MDYKKRVEELKDEMIDSIIKVVNIPSVKDENSKEYPYGEDIDKALKKTLEICESLGFKTHYDEEGYYGYAEIGEGEEMLGILGHLDVVPAGEITNWNSDPFNAEIREGKLYGRGTQDDKGPTLAAIYAVKALMDSGVKFNKRIRFIFGTDEENLWGGISKYMDNEEIPTFGFTPDAEFPMIHAEKGLLQAKLVSDVGSDVNLSSGNAFNAVPDKSKYNGKDKGELKKELDKLGFEYEEDEESIYVIGKGAHASQPHNGINAIARLCIALDNIGINSKAIKFIAEVVGEDYNGKNIFGNCEDEPSGKITFNIGMINLDKNMEEVSVDIRIPVTKEKSDIVENIKEKIKDYDLKYEEFDYLDSLYVPKDHELIKTLRKVYEEETELDSTPLVIGGATYARSMDNCVAFGAIFPGQEKVEHQANEYIEVDRLMDVTKIYAKAVYELTR